MVVVLYQALALQLRSYFFIRVPDLRDRSDRIVTIVLLVMDDVRPVTLSFRGPEEDEALPAKDLRSEAVFIFAFGNRVDVLDHFQSARQGDLPWFPGESLR